MDERKAVEKFQHQKMKHRLLMTRRSSLINIGVAESPGFHPWYRTPHCQTMSLLPGQLHYWLGLPACAIMDWLLMLVLEWCQVGLSVAKQHWISTIELLGHDHPALPVGKPIYCLGNFWTRNSRCQKHHHGWSTKNATLNRIKLSHWSNWSSSPASRAPVQHCS